jgi:hypothetical protein
VIEGVAAAGKPCHPAGEQHQAPRPRVGKRAAPLPHQCYLPAPTTSQHRSTLPFHMARLKSSHECLVSGFWPKTCSPASCWRMRGAPAATMASTCTHHLTTSPHTAVSHGTPEIKPRILGFGFLAQNPLPSLVLANARAPCCHHGSNLHPPPHNITPHRRFTWHARN